MKYPFFLRIIHWLMALCILGLIALGWWMTHLPKEHPFPITAYDIHKSFGVTVLILAVLRIVVRTGTIPTLPDTIVKWEQRAAHAGHFLFYCFMVGVPVSGYILSNAAGYPVAWFGLSLPMTIGKDEAVRGVAQTLHNILPYILLGIVVIHVAAVIKHHMKDKVNLLKRMF